MPFAATWMDLEMLVILSEVSQTKTNIIYHLYVESKNTIQMILFTKQKYTHRYRKQTYSCQRGRQEGQIRSMKLTHTTIYKIDQQHGWSL